MRTVVIFRSIIISTYFPWLSTESLCRKPGQFHNSEFLHDEDSRCQELIMTHTNYWIYVYNMDFVLQFYFYKDTD